MSILKTLLYRSAFTLLLICAGILFTSQKSITTREYQLKAAFLFNFTQFVEWPQKAFQTEQAPAIMGILGNDPFGTYIDETVVGETINGHSLIVKRYKKVEDIQSCHILFINLNDQEHLKKALAELKERNILTVSDEKEFIKLGGMIRFFTENNKIQFQINPEAAKTADLVISSKLLRLAKTDN
jgi:hypothetical protein